MKLSFLGKAYEASMPPVESSDTGEKVTFLGRHSAVKKYTVTQRQQPPEEFTFLGRRYTR
ncbi:hypothetical protein C7271_22215 [filamentous cyanobacterium CCP5]|nr:hypothetical protein C7271_22215 [filamentous cyanobacterium CCP5]